jgi:hypothetical protein
MQIILACKNARKKPNKFCDAYQARFLDFGFKKPIWKHCIQLVVLLNRSPNTVLLHYWSENPACEFA